MVDLQKFLEGEVEDDFPVEVVCSVEQLVEFLKGDDEVGAHRREEIGKLADFDTFEAVLRDEVPDGIRIFHHRWVDTAGKSRLTLKDLKVYGSDPVVEKSCPTPSQMANGLFDWYVIRFAKAMIVYDVVSAFPHAAERNKQVYMWPPQEWCDDNGIQPGATVWHMLQVLYGRGSAGETFQLLHEAIILSVLGFKFRLLDHEPCMYYCMEKGTMVIHHVDDGRMAGSSEDVGAVVAWMSKYLLLKVSGEIGVGDGYKYLNRIRVRLEDGWATIHDGKHIQNIRKIPELPSSAKVVPTPSVKRGTDAAKTYRVRLGAKEYRSIVGIYIHLSLDGELIVFAVKEMARRLNDPQPEDWCAAVRLTRWLGDKGEFANVQRVTKWGDVPVVDAWTDSDWAGVDDGRSTSGNHLETDGFKVYHSSVTQPGLPALSSAEAETRSMARGGCIGLQLKVLLSEIVGKADLRLKCDAQAAIDGAQKLSGSRLRHLEIAQSYSRRLLRGKHARVDKVPGKANVADCLTKHLSPEDTANHLRLTGFQKFDRPWKLVKLARINKVEDLVSAEQLVEQNEKLKRVREVADGLEIAKKYLEQDFAPQVSENFGDEQNDANGET